MKKRGKREEEKKSEQLFQKNYNIDQIIQPSSREQEKQEDNQTNSKTNLPKR